MVDFRAIMGKLGDIGFFDVVLPFLLIYVVIFGILEKSGIFSKKTDGTTVQEDSKLFKNINAVIAFVFALFTVASIQTVQYIQSFITRTIIFVIFILVVLILLGFIFGDKYMDIFYNMDDNGKRTKIKGWIVGVIASVVILTAVIVLMIVTGAWDVVVNWFEGLDGINSEDFWTVVVVLGIIGVLVWTSGGLSKTNNPAEPDKTTKE